MTRLNLDLNRELAAIYPFLNTGRLSDLDSPAAHALDRYGRKKPATSAAGSTVEMIGHPWGGHDLASDVTYFCHVRFLWRFDFKRFRRLCLFIFRRRFFFRLPMV
jgi:hypothetical protein